MEAKKHYIDGLGSLTRGDLEAAERSFRESLVMDDNFGLGHLGLSQALDRQGKFDDAIEAAQKAIALMPEDPLPHTSLSRLYQQKDMIDEAEAEMAISMRLQNEGNV